MSILLLLCLIGPFACTFAFLQYQRHALRKTIKRAMISGLDEKELVAFTFSVEESKTQLHWEHSREFEYKGQMYDVVSAEQKGDSMFYRCWWDHEETKLNKQLHNLVASQLGKNPQIPQQQKVMVQFIKLFYHESRRSEPHGDAVCPPIYAPERRILSSDFIFTPPSPPPRIA